MDTPCVLIIDDEPQIISSIRRLLRVKDIDVLTAVDGVAGLELLANNEVAVVVSDYQMPGISGMEVLKKAREISPDSVRVMMTGHLGIDLVLDATNRGEVYRIIEKPWNPVELQVTIEQCIEKYCLKRENKKLQAKLINQTRTEAVRATIVTLSHEINNALNTMVLSIADLKRAYEKKELPEDYAETLEQIKDDCNQISALISRLKAVEDVKITEYLLGIEMIDISTASLNSSNSPENSA